MHSFVILQLMLSVEGHGAGRALERLVPGVDAKVAVQIAALETIQYGEIYTNS